MTGAVLEIPRYSYFTHGTITKVVICISFYSRSHDRCCPRDVQINLFHSGNYTWSRHLYTSLFTEPWQALSLRYTNISISFTELQLKWSHLSTHGAMTYSRDTRIFLFHSRNYSWCYPSRSQCRERSRSLRWWSLRSSDGVAFPRVCNRPGPGPA